MAKPKGIRHTSYYGYSEGSHGQVGLIHDDNSPPQPRMTRWQRIKYYVKVIWRIPWN